MKGYRNRLRILLVLALMLAVGIAGGVWLDRLALPVHAAQLPPESLHRTCN